MEDKKQKELDYIAGLDIPYCLKSNFKLGVDSIYVVAGGKLTIDGYVAEGAVRAGETFQISKETGFVEGKIEEVLVHQWERRPNGVAYSGEHVALTVSGLQKDDLAPRDRIVIRNANKYTE